MKLQSSPLFSVAAKDRFEFTDGLIDELYNLVNNINQHAFRNLIPVIYYNLKVNRYLSKLPKDLVKRLKSEYYNAIALDMKQRGWFENWIREKLPHDIEIILMKGSANWGTIYPVEAPRTGCDIDILVRERDFEKIVEIIERDATKTILDESRVFTNKNNYEYVYIVDDYSISVDIHRRISHPFVGDVDYERLFKNSKRHPYYRDKRIRILSPEERIINTVIHSIKHTDITACEIVDTYRIVQRYRLDIKDIIGTAIRYKVSDYLVLFLTHIYKLVENDSGFISYVEDRGEPITAIKRNIFELLYISNKRINFRIRQLLSHMLVDNPIDFVRFMTFYVSLRGKDIFYNYFSRFSWREYAK